MRALRVAVAWTCVVATQGAIAARPSAAAPHPQAPSTLRPPASAPAQTPPAPRPPAPQPAQPAAPVTGQPTASAAPAQAPEPVPTAQSLGLPIYPTAQYLASYDAGRGQKYVLFGTTAPYAEVVGYYRTQLSDKGDQVFREPLTHVFEVGRFREETMAFPPGVTVKDWTSGGSQGYPHQQAGAQTVRYPTVIMLVPQPPTPQPQQK